MNLSRTSLLMFQVLALGLATDAAGAVTKRKAPESDLASIETRRVSVDLAAKLAKVEAPEPLVASTLARPFNPAGFNMTRPAATVAAGPVGPAPRAFGDREILTALASKVTPKGTVSRPGSPSLLNFGKKNLRPGDRLTVNYEGQDYTLELVGFDNTNFTLRLNKEEITRPIKPGKNQ